MVYCTRCGTLNPDANNNCSNCGAPLIAAEQTARPYTYEHQRNVEGYRRSHGGSGIGLLIAGLFIVIIGVAALTGFTAFWAYFWPIMLILIGLWVLLLGLRRNRRYRQPPPS
ncbi:MAG: hypothetical protein M1540_00480 [Candidatus Bathyarchaeota archaeon]|nr:hypothetical protein [Candidatus Bathyarchaeota archaeon]